MNRGEELRKKFAAKAASNPFDEQKVDFTISLDAVLVSERNAKAASKTFVDQLYAEFADEKEIRDEFVRKGCKKAGHVEFGAPVLPTQSVGSNCRLLNMPGQGCLRYQVPEFVVAATKVTGG